MQRLGLRPAAMGFAGLLVVSACTDEDGDAELQERPSGAETAEESSEPASPEPVTHAATLEAEGHEVELSVDVGPVVRDGDHASMPMEFEVVGDTSGQAAAAGVVEGVLKDLSLGVAAGSFPTQVRLVDTADLVAYPTARAGGLDSGITSEHGIGTEVMDVGHIVEPGGPESARWEGVFAAPEADQVGVLLPYLGFVEDVPVVDGPSDDIGTPADIAADAVSADLDQLEARAFPVQQRRESLDSAVLTRSEGDEASITVDADVLFEFDEYELTDDADEILGAAAEELSAASGDLLIVGHTDDVGSDPYNQELSENRADAVHERLEELADLSAFSQVRAEGRSFDEPVASNDSDEGRALNRRVELHFDPPAESAAPSEETDGTGVGESNGPDDSADAQLPDTDGPEAADSVELTHDGGGTVEVSVESIHRTGNVVVGRIAVTQVSGTGAVSWPLSSGLSGGRGQGIGIDGGTASTDITDAPTLIAGGSRLFPLDYALSRSSSAAPGDEPADSGDDDDSDGGGTVTATPGERGTTPVANEGSREGPGQSADAEEDDGPRYVALTDLTMDAELTSGQTAVATVLWPAAGSDTVTLDVPSHGVLSVFHGGEYPWRLTDVPVS